MWESFVICWCFLSPDGSDGSIHPYELVEGTDDSTVCDDFDDSFDSDSSVENENSPKGNHHKVNKF